MAQICLHTQKQGEVFQWLPSAVYKPLGDPDLWPWSCFSIRECAVYIDQHLSMPYTSTSILLNLSISIHMYNIINCLMFSKLFKGFFLHLMTFVQMPVISKIKFSKKVRLENV